LAILTSLAVGLAATAKADITLDWSFTDTSGSVNASGTLTVESNPVQDIYGYSGYLVTSISGTFLGQPITGELGPYSVDGLYGDDLLANLTGVGQQLTGGLAGGLNLSYGSGQEENIWYAGAEFPGLINQEYYNHIDGTFKAVIAAPEPSQAASMLFLSGLSGAGWLLLKLRRRKPALAA
jgi:hypothetical protein